MEGLYIGDLGFKRMNILFITGDFATNEKSILGGMAGAVYKSALGMQKRGHYVRILAASTQNKEWKYNNLEVISVRTQNVLSEASVAKSLYYILQREIIIQKQIRLLDKQKKINVIQYTGWFGIGLLNYNRIPAVMRVSSYTKIQLVNNYSKKYWIVRNDGEYGKILPWNYDKIIDLEQTERNFIERMTNKCPYVYGKKVLPKCSLLYEEFMLLNLEKYIDLFSKIAYNLDHSI